LTLAGDLRVVASADLGGLGAKEGPPASYSWTMPSLMPLALPWLALLAWLMLPPNRTGRAWWIWLPLAGVVGLTSTLRALLENLPGMGFDMVADAAGALAFGPAALWLLASYLKGRHRLLTFLAMLVIQGVMSLVAWGVVDEGLGPEFFLPVMGCWIAASSVALSLAGWVCRRRFRPRRLLLWFLIWLVSSWMAAITPMFLNASAAGASGLWGMFATVVATATGFVFVTWLPFLVLSFANPFFRERLGGLLRLPTDAPEPVTELPSATAT